MVNYGAMETSIGLTSAEAARRLAEFGPNELEAADTDSLLKVALRQMFNFIFLLTSLSSMICYATGDQVKGTFLVCLVFFIWLFNTIGEYSGQDAGAALRAMSPEEAEVYRDGVLQKVPVPDIVIGDVLNLKIGMVVPADLKVLECVELQTNESVLTGEPKEKNKMAVKEMPKDFEATGDELPPCMLFKQTEIVAGRGTGEVTATGMHTRVGLIAERLKNPELTEGKVEAVPVILNPLQKSVNKLGTIIALVCGVVICVASVAAFALKYQNLPQACAKDDRVCILNQSMIRGLLMATAIIPHGLPLVVCVMLRVGSQLMAEKSALVMRKSAVDYLGATQIICTDKTGTLTAGVMAAKVLISLHRSGKNTAPISQARFYPLRGLDPQGGIFVAEDLTKAEEQKLDAGVSADDLNIVNLGNPEAKLSDKALPTGLITRASLTASFVNCHSCKIIPPKYQGDKWTSEGSTTDAALKVAAWKGDLVDSQPKGVDVLSQYKNQEHLELPFSSSRKMSATVHKLPAGEQSFQGIQLGKEHTHIAILKGAPDRVLPSVTSLLEVSNGKLMIANRSISNDEKARIADQNDSLARQALRSILMAVKPLTSKDVDKLAAMKGQVDARLTFLMGPGLTFLSLWGIFDPPRSSVPPSVQLCHEAGIRVVMITGDQQPTALAIGKLVGIVPESADAKQMARPCADLHQKPLVSSDIIRQVSGDNVKAPVRASEAEYKDVEQLADMTSKVNIWSRAQPTDKVCIVDSLDNQEYIASMTGDGVNDAPALKRADIGVAMGISGTPVTKNAADMILMDDNFSTIVAAVAEGRKIYGNVQKYVLFNLSVKGSECFCCLVAIFSGLPMPIQGLPQLVNLVATHIIPPMSLAWEDAEEYTMKIKPRATKGDLVLNSMLMYFRWLPYVFSFGVVIMTSMIFYLWMETGFFTIKGLVATPSALLAEQQQHACQVAGVMNENGKFISDATPFHCHCTMRNSYWDSKPAIHDQWGRFDSSDMPIDRWTGSSGNAFDLDKTPWAGSGFDKFLKECKGSDGKLNLCWRDPDAERPLLDSSKTCAAWGSRIATTMSYVSIQLTEVLTLMTFRTDGFFGYARRSYAYLGVLVFNLCILMLVVYVPLINNFLTLAPLNSLRFMLACVAPVLLVGICELTKKEFRMQLRRTHELDSPENFAKQP
mmetsp:Transcript_70770/g.122507  ORF Transcript_70770/g.122507 Transcript_70770/m.122507 type:complete len:1174 (+) Transcript_70770:131-3652(+)